MLCTYFKSSRDVSNPESECCITLLLRTILSYVTQQGQYEEQKKNQVDI